MEVRAQLSNIICISGFGTNYPSFPQLIQPDNCNQTASQYFPRSVALAIL